MLPNLEIVVVNLPAAGQVVQDRVVDLPAIELEVLLPGQEAGQPVQDLVEDPRAAG